MFRLRLMKVNKNIYKLRCKDKLKRQLQILLFVQLSDNKQEDFTNGLRLFLKKTGREDFKKNYYYFGIENHNLRLSENGVKLFLKLKKQN